MEHQSTTLKIAALLCSILCTLTIAKRTEINLMSIMKNTSLKFRDSGHANNCGSVPINFTWTPKDLSPSGEVSLYLDYVLPYDLNQGFYNLTIYEQGDSIPTLIKTDNFTCEGFKPCPLPKGLHFSTSKTIHNLHNLQAHSGTYDAIVQVWNSDLQYMLCINLTVTVLDESGYDGGAPCDSFWCPYGLFFLPNWGLDGT